MKVASLGGMLILLGALAGAQVRLKDTDLQRMLIFRDEFRQWVRYFGEHRVLASDRRHALSGIPLPSKLDWDRIC